MSEQDFYSYPASYNAFTVGDNVQIGTSKVVYTIARIQVRNEDGHPSFNLVSNKSFQSYSYSRFQDFRKV